MHEVPDDITSEYDPVEDIRQELQETEELTQQLSNLQLQKGWLQLKIEQQEGELEMSKSQLFRDWREVLERYNLLEHTPEESDNGSIISNTITHGQMTPPSQTYPQTPTSSELEHAALDARDKAMDNMREKEIRLREARQKLANWPAYYDDECARYRKCVAEGTMESARTFFDGVLLQEQLEATGILIQAEREFEESKRRVRSMGIIQHDVDQESGFADHSDDGYRESMEAEIISHVNRSSIEKWLSEEDDMSGLSTECDDWDFKIV